MNRVFKTTKKRGEKKDNNTLTLKILIKLMPESHIKHFPAHYSISMRATNGIRFDSCSLLVLFSAVSIPKPKINTRIHARVHAYTHQMSQTNCLSQLWCIILCAVLLSDWHLLMRSGPVELISFPAFQFKTNGECIPIFRTIRCNAIEELFCN